MKESNTSKNLMILTTTALCAVLLVCSKEILAFLPNVELVTCLLMIMSIVFSLRFTLWVSILFCLLECLLYGFGLWTIQYFMIWPLFVFITFHFKKFLDTDIKLAIVSGIYGAIFGFLSAIPFFMISIQTGWIYFLQGIFFDVVHMISNFIIMLVLYKPIYSLFIRLKDKYKIR